VEVELRTGWGCGLWLMAWRCGSVVVRDGTDGSALGGVWDDVEREMGLSLLSDLLFLVMFTCVRLAFSCHL